MEMRERLAARAAAEGEVKRLADLVEQLRQIVDARDAVIARMEAVGRERDRRDVEVAAILRRAHAALDAGGAPNGTDMTLEERIKATLPLRAALALIALGAYRRFELGLITGDPINAVPDWKIAQRILGEHDGDKLREMAVTFLMEGGARWLASSSQEERRCMSGGHGWNHLCLIHDAVQIEPDGTCAEYKRLIASASRSKP